MAMTTIDKNLAIASLERVIQDAREAAGVASLAALETEVAGLRTAYTTDPATVTDAQIGATANKMSALTFPSMDDVSAVIDEAQAAVV
jgi:hypothetical protein